MKKVYKDKKGDGPLVSSQEQRALLVPVVDRLSTANQPVVRRSLCSPIGLHKISLVRASGESFRRRVCVFDALGGTRVSWANCSVGAQSYPTPPRHPAVRPDSTRPWYVRVLNSTSGLDRWGNVQDTCFECLGRYDGRLSFGRTVLSASCRAGAPPRQVYIGLRLFALLERRSGNVFSMPWRVRGTLVS